MDFILAGYGRMGREVEKILVQRGHRVIARVDPVDKAADAKELTEDLLRNTDIVIEFSLPEAVLSNARLYAEAGVGAVVGTTGIGPLLDELKKIIIPSQGAYLWGTNFSIGAHIFFNLVNRAAALVDGIPDYDLLVYEIHHRQKKDSPSGTALTLGEGILKNMSRKTQMVTQRLDRAPHPEELHIASLRGGSVPGTHTVLIDSLADTIEIKHTARNRSGFALGAVMGAEWLAGKSGFYQVEDFITDIFKRNNDDQS